jgi:hypothetical protein
MAHRQAAREAACWKQQTQTQEALEKENKKRSEAYAALKATEYECRVQDLEAQDREIAQLAPETQAAFRVLRTSPRAPWPVANPDDFKGSGQRALTSLPSHEPASLFRRVLSSEVLKA